MNGVGALCPRKFGEKGSTCPGHGIQSVGATPADSPAALVEAWRQSIGHAILRITRKNDSLDLSCLCEVSGVDVDVSFGWQSSCVDWTVHRV
jgi:hypothetical protein